MILKILFFGLILVFISGACLFCWWNYVIGDLPIKGIVFGHLSFGLAIKLSAVLVVLVIIQQVLLLFMKDLFKRN